MKKTINIEVFDPAVEMPKDGEEVIIEFLNPNYNEVWVGTAIWE